MIYLDSWIWLELFLEGEKSERCEEILSSIQKGRRAIISTIALTEIKYAIAKKVGMSEALTEIALIELFPNLLIVPVTTDVAKLAADLRLKYYSRKCALSYADAIHLATAILSRCTHFYTGDPDFEAVDEIKVEVV